MIKWVCSQLGRREHYAIPRSLSRLGCLEKIYTDAWVTPTSLTAMLASITKANWRDRYHHDLKSATVKSQPLARSFHKKTTAKIGSWDHIIVENRRYQSWLIKQLEIDYKQPELNPSIPHAFFAYSYAALEPFRWAKNRGWKKVLGQIDPGPEEERIVRNLEASAPDDIAIRATPAPPKYWDDWRRECDLADIIIANSEWSKSLLARDGVNENKIRVVPLAMEQNRATFASHSKVPDEFNQDRPLHVLCLGQINLRKGIVPLIGAFQKLQHAHVHLHLVGNGPLFPWVKSQNLPNVTCYGAVGREESFQSYRNADIFILPSFSDGFAITQLEAQIAGLPIIASNNCGSVVQNQHNGLLLDEVSAEAIADAVTSCLNNPARISEWMKNSKLEARFTLEGLKDELQKISIDLSDN